MSADQVLRSAIVKQLFGFSYVQLAFHIYDSHPCADFVVSDLPIKALKNQLLTQTLNA